jgi:tetrahydromethanopterin S-methyltransferase subunit E
LKSQGKRAVRHTDDHQHSRSDKHQHSTWLDIVRIAPGIIAGTVFFAAFDSVILSFLPLALLDSGFDQSHAFGALDTGPCFCLGASQIR